MAEKISVIERATRGVMFILDEQVVMRIVSENADGPSYADEEDTNPFFLFATGEMAEQGHAVLKDSRPFDVVAADVAKEESRAGIWSFPTEKTLRAAYRVVADSKDQLSGTVFMLKVKRKWVPPRETKEDLPLAAVSQS